MDRGAWRATVHGVAKSWTRLEQLSTAQYSTKSAMPGVTKPEFRLCTQALMHHVSLTHTHTQDL